MKSIHEKAAVFGKKYIGHIDPGSLAVKYIFEAMYNCLERVNSKSN